MPEISDARQALRDYARRPINTVVVDEENQRLNVATVQLGETAGLTFEALQGVLTLCDDIRSGRRVLSPLGLVNMIEIAIKEPFER